MFQNRNLQQEADADNVLVLAGDHVDERGDSVMPAEHVTRCADVTVAGVEVPLGDAMRFGVMAVDARACVVDSQERPALPRRWTGLDSLVSSGCIISSAVVQRSILFAKMRVGDF